MDDQKRDEGSSLSGSDTSLKKDLPLEIAKTALDFGESLMGIASTKQVDNEQQATNEGNILKCYNDSQIEVMFEKERLKFDWSFCKSICCCGWRWP